MGQQTAGSGLQLQDIFDRIANGRKEPPYDAEQAAHYFVAIREDFESVKGALSALSGGLILLLSGSGGQSEAAAAVAMTLRSLHEAREHLRGVRVPRGLERHHGTLGQLTDELIGLCGQTAGRDLPDLHEHDAHHLLRQVQTIYGKLKTVACMPAGLSMVALENGCACGMHRQAGSAAVSLNLTKG